MAALAPLFGRRFGSRAKAISFAGDDLLAALRWRIEVQFNYCHPLCVFGSKLFAWLAGWLAGRVAG